MSIVEDRGFLQFLKTIDARYEPPSRRNIMREILPNLYEEKKEQVTGNPFNSWVVLIVPQTCGRQTTQWAT